MITRSHFVSTLVGSHKCSSPGYFPTSYLKWGNHFTARSLKSSNLLSLLRLLVKGGGETISRPAVRSSRAVCA
eukprot:6045535-Amphidinium_carterae.1